MKTTTSKLSVGAAISIVVGSIIGSGIFMKPATMAAQVGNGWLLLGVWVIAGILSLLGALVFSELGAMFPKTGGLYVYLKEMFGPFIAFLYGWGAFVAVNTAAVAAIAFVCAWYAGYFVSLPSFSNETINACKLHLPGLGNLYPLRDAGIKAVAIAIVVLLTIINIWSVRQSTRLQVIFTAAKVLALLLLFFGVAFSPGASIQNLGTTLPGAAVGWKLAAAIMAALTGAFVSYDGWQNINFMAGEMQHPQRDLPRSIIGGVLICILVYVLINLAYTLALPIQELAGANLVATDALEKTAGSLSAAIIAALIVLVTFGAVNGNIMSTARVSFAMAEDGLFFRLAQRMLNASPAGALVLHGFWTCLLIVSGSFDLLADMFVFITWLFIAVTCIGMMRLRKKVLDEDRPFKMWGYPWSLYIFLAFTLFYLVGVLQYEISMYRSAKVETIPSLMGLALMLTGVPFYIWFLKRRKLVR